MIFTIEMLKEKYSNYANINDKIHREVKKGNLIYIARGIYETQKDIDGKYLCQFIYAPSYLSFDYVLYKNGLIPETVYNTFTCATFGKRKKKVYKNEFGTYVFRDIPKQVFNFEVSAILKDDYCFHIASSEKALCDKLYIIAPLHTITALKDLLFCDLRIDIDEFKKLNKEKLLFLAPLYHSTNLNLLIKLLKGEKI